MQKITNFLQPLVDGWEVKTIIAGVVSVCTNFLCNTHVIMFNVFIALVVIDLFTKQISLSAQCINESTGTPKSEIDTVSKVLGVPVAFNKGYIKSFYMRSKFLTKMTTYFIAVISAALIDVMITNQGSPEYVLSLMYTYLGATEFLSILENLRDGGNTTIGKILSFAEGKLINRLK